MPRLHLKLEGSRAQRHGLRCRGATDQYSSVINAGGGGHPRDDRGYNLYSVPLSLRFQTSNWVYCLSRQSSGIAEKKAVFADHRITKQMSHLLVPVCSVVSYPVRVLVCSIT